MNAAIAALIIATAPADAIEIPQEQAVSEITRSCESGSLIFSQGDCLAVRAYTNSPYTHVAVVIYDESGSPYVYDSMNGVGVRKLSLDDYLETQAPDKVHLFHPKRSLRTKEVSEFQDHLDEQLGRPYSVKHHITGRRSKGLHCSEYVSEALVEIEWLKVKNPARVSPASLAEGIAKYGVYRPAETYLLEVKIEPIPEPQGRVARIWQGTKNCTLSCCSQLSRWILCR